MTPFLLFQGWYIVTYALGIYHLNLFIAFLSPKVDPSLMEDSGTAGPLGAVRVFCDCLYILLGIVLGPENTWTWACGVYL